MEKAINDAVYNKNVVIVCSAGNHNNEKTWYPSDFDATISVISTQKYKNAWSRHTKAPSSNYGKKKDLSAPGDAIYTTTLGGAYVSGFGTSYAAPSVAAVAALMLYVNPNLKAREVKEILCSTATDLYTPGSDRYTGSGNVNAYRAVAAAAGRRIQTNAEALPQPEAKAQSDGRHTIKVSWDRIPQANGYWIYRAAEKNGHYKRIKQIRKGDQRYFLDPKRKFNKNYFYKVKAYGTTVAILAAICSSWRNRPLERGLVVFGEVGLAGEIRPAARGQERLREAAKLGFSKALIPRANMPRQPVEGLEIIPVDRLSDALEGVLGG